MYWQQTEDYLNAHTHGMLDFVNNGSVRFLALPDSPATDAAGFPSDSFTPRTTEFLPCSWAAKKIEEKEVATQTRSLSGYEINLSQTAPDGSPVVVRPSDRVEIKFRPSADETEELEIVSLLNISKILWRVFAVRLNDES